MDVLESRGPTKGTFLRMLNGGWRGVREGLGYRFVLLGIGHDGE